MERIQSEEKSGKTDDVYGSSGSPREDSYQTPGSPNLPNKKTSNFPTRSIHSFADIPDIGESQSYYK